MESAARLQDGVMGETGSSETSMPIYHILPRHIPDIVTVIRNVFPLYCQPFSQYICEGNFRMHVGNMMALLRYYAAYIGSYRRFGTVIKQSKKNSGFLRGLPVP